MARAEPLPEDALLRAYAPPKGYTDCFTAPAPRGARLEDFVLAFYTTPLFRAERFILQFATRRRISDADAAALAAGDARRFAVWEVEAEAEGQILLRDSSGATRSWLRVSDGKLWFGSAVVSAKADGKLPPLARALLPLHKLYSRALLSAAARRLNT